MRPLCGSVHCPLNSSPRQVRAGSKNSPSGSPGTIASSSTPRNRTPLSSVFLGSFIAVGSLLIVWLIPFRSCGIAASRGLLGQKRGSRIDGFSSPSPFFFDLSFLWSIFSVAIVSAH
ncbi:uncharacterized protein BDW47DRAFT_106685 [Aspergillus candidus]|uniref:Uncharacterized protein n=1 Tax=Aspergillus candidus TaxID=41067 RepID=A0A2I2FAR5_ASPCN|nr:hypothetical protein BDW47DRAFT_106685 [Aspergillus candidus]PLB37717.1 hypothetical protein BDW47DRAFT_106685 [Aspergillus candidus]